METVVFFPSGIYRVKLFFLGLFSAFFSFPWLVIVPGYIAYQSGIKFTPTVVSLIGIAAFIYLGLVMLIVNLYFRSIQYEIHEDEVIVQLGLLTKRVKHVPFRTITNVEVIRGPVDRILGIGTLEIQTAGASGTTSAEEKLVGLADVHEVYTYIAHELRRFRGALSPSQSEQEISIDNEQFMLEKLHELRAIRLHLERVSS